MNKVNKLLTLSTFGVLCLTSCGHTRYTHSKLNGELEIYSADINHNGIIEDNPVKVGSKIYRSEKNVTWQESFDAIMSQISDDEILKICADNMGISKDEEKRTQLARYEILHEAEEMLMDTGAVMPLYNYSDPYLLKPNVSDIYFMPLGTKYLDQLTRDGKSNEKFDISTGTKADTLDPADNSDSSTSNALNNCFRGLSYYVKDTEPVEGQSRTFNSKLDWNYVLLDHVTEPSGGDRKYTFEIKPNNKFWSDGKDLTAIDFVYTWHRACSGYHGTWGFVFDCIEGYEDYASEEKENQAFYPGDINCPKGKTISGITINDTYSFSVKLTYDCSFFKELCSFTAYAPLQKEKMENGTYYDSSEKKYVPFDPRGKDAGVSTWWNDANNWVCNGPFALSNINNKQTGTFDLVRNDKNGCTSADLYNTKPSAISYHLIDDDSAMYMDYKRNRYDMVDSFPSAMTDKVINDMPNDYRVADQIGNYYFFFNVNDNALDCTTNEDEGDKEIRRANLRKGLIRLVNRIDMTDTIVKSGATDANGFVSTDIKESCIPDPKTSAPNITALIDETSGEYVEAEWHSRNKDTHSTWGSNEGLKNTWLANRNDKLGGFWKSTEDYPEYFKEEDPVKKREIQEKILKENIGDPESWDNPKEGTALYYLKKGIDGTNITYDKNTGKFKNFPTLTISTNTGTGHEALCERLQYVYGLYGIKLKIETTEWTSFQTFIKNGDVSMARNGWIADFSDARTYLELFTSTNSSNYCQLGKTEATKGHIHKSQ